MRILLAHHLPLNGSGSGHSTHDLALALRQAGHDVRALIVDIRSQGDEPFSIRRILDRQAASSEDRLPFELPSFGAEPLGSTTFESLSDGEIASYRQVLRKHLDAEVEAFDPHVIHAQHVWLFGQLALETGVPYVVNISGPELISYREDPRYRGLADQAAENAGRILAPNSATASLFGATFNDGHQVTICPPLVDQSRFLRPQLSEVSRPIVDLLRKYRSVVAYAGPLVPQRAVDVLLNAAARYEEASADIGTVICGDGPQRRELEHQAARLGLQRVHFLGSISRDDCAAVYHTAELVVLPGQQAEANMAMFEAMAAGTPVIRASEGATRGLSETSDGAVVVPGDHELVADAVLRALQEDWKSTKGPQAARQIAEQHDLASGVGRFAALYEAVLKERFGS